MEADNVFGLFKYLKLVLWNITGIPYCEGGS